MVAKATFDVFISYKRKLGSDIANFVTASLAHLGYKVFLDVNDMPSGPFPHSLSSIIQRTPNFILILTRGCFSPSKSTNWFIKEIELAIEANCNILPLKTTGFKYPESLPSSSQHDLISKLKIYHTIEYVHAHTHNAIQSLHKRMLLSNHRRKQLIVKEVGKANVKGRIIYIGKFFACEAYFDLLFDKQIIGSGGARSGFCIPFITDPGAHTIQVIPSNRLIQSQFEWGYRILGSKTFIDINFPEVGEYEVYIDVTRMNKVWFLKGYAKVS